MTDSQFPPADHYGFGFGHGMNDYYQPAPVSLDMLSYSPVTVYCCYNDNNSNVVIV